MASKTVRSRPIQGQALFFITSPRTPFKAIPEIKLWNEKLHGQTWDKNTQLRFYELLREESFFEGNEAKDKAFAGRDRINRLPKALGFVRLPIIGLTSVGREFIETNNKEEILLRQMLKLQYPSPYHPLGKNATDYYVKPYLELFRLIRDLGELAFDELHIFAMQLVNYQRYDTILSKIKRYREECAAHKGKLKLFKKELFYREASIIYAQEIERGALQIRENGKKTKTKEEYLETKISNLRDYADAAVRNLRSTGLVHASAIGKTLSILPERQGDVDYFLRTIPREPCFVKDQERYEEYLWNPSIPKLLSDNESAIINELKQKFNYDVDKSLSLNRLKDVLNQKREERRNEKIEEQVKVLKSYKDYEQIEETFKTMHQSYDEPLFFEWNTWRAMTMLDGGEIKANLKFDDSGMPMSTAMGNMADIECDYGDFDVIVEVTTSSGKTQFKMEGEPVPRHIGIHKEKHQKPTYCFFIAPTISTSTIGHFYSLFVSNIVEYGGKCNIIPMTLDTFRVMLKKAVEAPNKPTPQDIRKLFEKSQAYAKECIMNDATDRDWYDRITETVNNWLAIQ
ncbi:AlwI restriction endonuclease [Xylanibacter ruminicola]|uniref:AlwI restriction endonuclease n=1 Tax=Xylanibacter ruminicola TaxID=839 RepID=A0A1M7D5L1_XYLRU|nr:AlwI family type II restriction endonuclease [Xylanibacter ruminicola]SHL74479.1 AlwI restriction endonuclease [Xylanibacter ruminicola]